MFVTFLQRNLLASCLAALAARKPHISNSFWENKLSLRMKVLFLTSLSPAPPVAPKPPQQTRQDLNGFSCFGKSLSEIMGSWADAGGQDSYERGVVRGVIRGVVCHEWVGCPPRTLSERIWGQRCCAGPFPFTVSKAERCHKASKHGEGKVDSFSNLLLLNHITQGFPFHGPQFPLSDPGHFLGFLMRLA